MNFYERECRVSVIVPVYNALCDLKLCVESLKKYVKFNIDQVIIIDDCSPDPAVKVYLEELKTQGFNIIFNEKNLGFSCTVNKGMELTDSDVILLNSDTVVTSGWIDKIVQCAYSDNSIATVTPFSNAATICSLPIFLQENKIPKGFTIDQYAEVVERCSMKKYPEISVAVGFCMFIKRTVINEIGLFDAESFKKGYGEENDFCWRASEYGYIHVLCDDTFIYHKGTGSFSSKEKMQLMQSHDTILQERYPELYQKNSIFCSYDQSRDIRLIIELFSKTSPKCKNILYVLHNDFRNNSERPCGGTEFHVRDLTYLLRNDFNIFVIYPSGGYLNLLFILKTKKLV